MRIPRVEPYEYESRPVAWRTKDGETHAIERPDPYTRDGIPMFKRVLSRIESWLDDNTSPRVKRDALMGARRAGGYGFQVLTPVAVKHCRRVPEHEAKGAELMAVLALRARVTDEEWADSSPSAWPGGYRYGEVEWVRDHVVAT